MSVEHVLPSTINDGLSEEPQKSDAIVTRFELGGRMARHWNDNVQKSYTAKIMPIEFGERDIDELKAFNQHILVTVYPFWVIEPWAETHRDVPCGPPADGAQTTFPLPIRDYSSILGVFKDKVFAVETSYTIHTSANILSDNNANVTQSIGDWVKVGASTAIARFTGDSLDGRACIKVAQAAAANNGAQCVDVPISNSTYYTISAYVKGSGSFTLKCVENDGSLTEHSSSPLTGVAGTWQQVTIAEFQTTGTTTACTISVTRAAATAAVWFVACVAISPGDNTRWWLPSVAPGLIEFDTAPTAATEVTVAGIGNRMTYVAMDKGGISWSREQTGHVIPASMSFMEVRER